MGEGVLTAGPAAVASETSQFRSSPTHVPQPLTLAGLLLIGSATLAGCAGHLFSTYKSSHPDFTRPVARIETRGGIEYGAATTEGVLMLGRTATQGPCRVHYFLGTTPMVDDGTIEPWGGVYYRAELDLKHQRAPLLGRELQYGDALLALVFDRAEPERVTVARARDPRIEGDVLAWPGRTLPAGTPLFVDDQGTLRFVGLVAGEATLGSDRFVVFTGLDRLREALATPRPQPQPEWVKYRPDDITVFKKGIAR